MANRKERRAIEKMYRKRGLSKAKAKELVNHYYTREAFKPGQKCKFNYEMIIRHPQFKQQIESFQNWVTEHKDDILTVKDTKEEGYIVTFEEDTQETPFWHRTETLIAVPTATIKLNGQEDTTVVLDDISEVVKSNNVVDAENVQKIVDKVTEQKENN